jgi:hypothetical protein
VGTGVAVGTGAESGTGVAVADVTGMAGGGGGSGEPQAPSNISVASKKNDIVRLRLVFRNPLVPNLVNINPSYLGGISQRFIMSESQKFFHGSLDALQHKHNQYCEPFTGLVQPFAS